MNITRDHSIGDSGHLRQSKQLFSGVTPLFLHDLWRAMWNFSGLITMVCYKCVVAYCSRFGLKLEGPFPYGSLHRPNLLRKYDHNDTQRCRKWSPLIQPCDNFFNPTHVFHFGVIFTPKLVPSPKGTRILMKNFSSTCEPQQCSHFFSQHKCSVRLKYY